MAAATVVDRMTSPSSCALYRCHTNECDDDADYLFYLFFAKKDSFLIASIGM